MRGDRVDADGIDTNDFERATAAVKRAFTKHAESIAHQLTFSVYPTILEEMRQQFTKHASVECEYGPRSELKVYPDVHISGDHFAAGPYVPLSQIILSAAQYGEAEPMLASLKRSVAIIEKALAEKREGE